MKERDLWTKRDEWIGKHQPALNNPAEASALLDQLKEVAGKYDIQIENPVIGSGRPRLIIKRFSLPLKLKVPGRRSYIFIMTCNDRLRSSCLKMLIWPSTAATRQ